MKDYGLKAVPQSCPYLLFQMFFKGQAMYEVLLKRSKTLQFVGIFLVFSVLLLAFIGLRIETLQQRINVDENIVWAVANSMWHRGDLNANWRLADKIMPYFSWDMHNFYSFNLLGLSVVTDDELQTISRIRLLNVGMQFCTLALVWMTLANSGIALIKRLLVMCALVVLPTMVFDAHLARTESFLYLLFAAIIYLASANFNASVRFTLFGLLLGVGAASKITFLATALVFAPELFSLLKRQKKELLLRIGTVSVATIAGFALTSPYTILQPQVYLDGIRLLANHYSGEHLPHSDPGSTIYDRAFHLILFSLMITGGAIALALRFPGSMPNWSIGVWWMSFVLLAYFATQSVFFERNISIALLGLTIIAFAFQRGKIAYAAGTLSIVIMAYWSVNIALLSGVVSDSNLRAWETRNFGAPVPHAWPKENPETYLTSCTEKVVGIYDFGDKTSQQIISNLGAKPIAIRSGAFSILPTSSLNTYLETTRRYYKCTGARP